MDIMSRYPQQSFRAADEFCYDAADDIIYYDPARLDEAEGRLALLHELAHATLAHFDYDSDFELFAMETRAWAHTRELASSEKVPCDESYIDECLASYATWLAKRATCPTCDNFSLQIDKTTYRCFRCHTRWQVHTDRLDRIRRVRLPLA